MSQVKITKERQTGLLPLVATDEITKSGKVSKRTVRQDTKEIAVMFCQMNKVGKQDGMPITHASDLLGVPYTLLKQWLREHDTLIVENEQQYIKRLAHRERVLLNSLFNPLDLAMQELNNRLLNNPDQFSNTELLKLVTTISEQYTRVYAMRLQRESESHRSDSAQQNTFTELKQIFTNAKNRLIIDQTDSNDTENTLK